MTDSEDENVDMPTLLGAGVGVAVVVLVLLVLCVVIARHGHKPHQAKGTDSSHQQALAITPEGAPLWECYDLDLVSSVQKRHLSLDVLTDVHPEHQSLIQLHTDKHTPTHAKSDSNILANFHVHDITHAHKQSQTPTSSYLNGPIMKCQDRNVLLDKVYQVSVVFFQLSVHKILKIILL